MDKDFPKLFVSQISAHLAVLIIIAIASYVTSVFLGNLRQGVAVSILITLVLTISLTYMTRRLSWLFLGIILVVISLLWLNFNAARFCSLKPLRLTAYALALEQSIPIDEYHGIYVRSGTRLSIEVVPISRSDSAADWRCVWSHSGDGQIVERSNCTVVFRVGSEEAPDLLSVNVMGTNCIHHRAESVIIYTSY